MTGYTISSLARRVKDTYDNLPLPLPVVAAMAADLLLARLRPMPLPGPRALHRTTGTALVVAGVGLNAWALAERRRLSPGPFVLERPEELVTTGPYAFTRYSPDTAAVIQAQDNRRRDTVRPFLRHQRCECTAWAVRTVPDGERLPPPL